MESVETFTDDEFKPTEHDYDLKICVQYGVIRLILSLFESRNAIF